MQHIYIPSSFAPYNVDKWLFQWSSVVSAPAITVHLPSGAWCSPGGIAMLLSCLRHRQLRGLHTDFSGDPSQDVFKYLQRMDFFSHLGLAISEDFQRHVPSQRFVPLRSITTVEEAQALATSITEFVDARCSQLTTSTSNSIRFLLAELGCNIVQHAEASQSGYGIGQAYPAIKVVEYAYCDHGIGILASLASNPEFAGRLDSDDSAIALAVTEGVSSSSDPHEHGGIGLFELNRICERMRAEVWLLSGNSCLHRNYASDVNRFWRVPHFQGTWVCFRVPYA